MKDLIRKLVETISPSGREEFVRNIIQAEIAGHVDEMYVDTMGNLHVRKGARSEDGLRIMLAAHMDEIGIVAAHIDQQGYVRFLNVGGVRPNTLIGNRVRFTNGIAGVIGSERLENAENAPGLEKLFVDVGAASKDDCPIVSGDMAGFERPMLEFGDRVVAKSLDNRISVAILIETLRALSTTPHELHFVFTTQEEVGPRAAATAAYAIEPDIALVVDVTPSGDTPQGIKNEIALGKGPAIKLRDPRMFADSSIVSSFIQLAEEDNLPYQLEVLHTGWTDAEAVQVSRAGVRTGGLAIPCRYIHTPSEMVDLRDVSAARDLLLRFLSKPVILA